MKTAASWRIHKIYTEAKKLSVALTDQRRKGENQRKIRAALQDLDRALESELDWVDALGGAR